LLTTLTLSMRGRVSFAEHAAAHDDLVAYRTLCTALGDHAPHLHHFKFICYIPPDDLAWYRSLLFAFISSMPARLGPITLKLLSHPDSIRHLLYLLPEACRRFEQLESVGVILSPYISRNKKLKESVVRGCRELEGRGLFCLDEGPSCAESGCQDRST